MQDRSTEGCFEETAPAMFPFLSGPLRHCGGAGTAPRPHRPGRLRPRRLKPDGDDGAAAVAAGEGAGHHHGQRQCVGAGRGAAHAAHAGAHRPHRCAGRSRRGLSAPAHRGRVQCRTSALSAASPGTARGETWPRTPAASRITGRSFCRRWPRASPPPSRSTKTPRTF